MNVYASGYGGCADAAVTVVTAGAKQKPGETRIQLLGRNAGIAREIVGSVMSSGFKGILLMISNPVDALTWVAYTVACRESGLSPSRLMGSGTVLDSARFREFLARRRFSQQIQHEIRLMGRVPELRGLATAGG